jgi:carbamoyltransferase
MNVLGISAFYHDSAAALLVDGRPVAAAQEERFSRIKNDATFPEQACAFCLEQAGLTSADLDAVVFYDKPLVKFERILHTFLNRAPRGLKMFRQAMPTWLKQKLWIPRLLHQQLPGATEYLYSSHHLSHAASAFYPSPFSSAAILTVDGVGEWSTCSYGVGHGDAFELQKELHFPHSLGLLYSAFTAYLGFRVNDGEYKVMGLAPYGEPKYLNLIFERLLDLHEDGSFALKMKYFGYLDQLSMTSAAFHELFGGPARDPEAPLEQRHMDLAASVQRATEILMLELANEIHRQTGEENLCLAGGVALNCVANGRLLREGPFKQIWIQPAAGDAGGALGAAFVGHLALGDSLPHKSGKDLMSAALLGPEFTDSEIVQALDAAQLDYTQMDTSQLLATVATELANGGVVGWHQGRMEFGPRALGNRSILADPRRKDMQRTLNQKIKFREGFRPFAPVVLEERAAEFFELEVPSPYMLRVSQVAEQQKLSVIDSGIGLSKLDIPRSTIPAVTHVDGSARVQTINDKQNPLFTQLLETFYQQTGCPVLVNTSFNVKDEPIVCTPQDAVECFLKSGIDGLAIGNFWIKKNEALREKCLTEES